MPVAPPSSPARSPLDAVVGDSAMGRRMRAFDWSRHPLGEPEAWPQSLKTALRLVLASRFPMWLGWGPELYFFCNDAYLPAVGIKENWVLGAPARKVWAEIWPTIGPRADSVLRTGAATWDESLPLLLERSGYPEETYQTFSYSPAPDDDGSVGGLLCVVTEETERVLAARRLALLRELAADFAGASTAEGVSHALRERLAARPHDAPFALLYLFDPTGTQARLAAQHGLAADTRDLAPETIRCDAATQTWPARALREKASPALVDDLALRFRALPQAPWDRPPRQALAVPLAPPGGDAPAGFVVVGLNPYRPLDAAYTHFVDTLAAQLAAALAHARAGEAERSRAQSLAELDRAKTEFFSDVSHELRTPLTLVLAPMEDLLRQPAGTLPAPARDLAAIAHRNALRLLELVNTLLDFSSLEAGRMQASFVPTDLAQLTNALASTFRSAVERAGLRYIVDCPPLDEPVWVDREMWQKIVLHLIANAFKFTLHGEVRVTLRAVGECVELAVHDTGPGIPPEARPRLFERFYRVHGTPGRTHEGPGIGLALVHELVKLHHGTVHVDSEPGAGSTFTVFLRRGRAHLPRERITTAEAASPATSGPPALLQEMRRWETLAADATPEPPPAGEASGDSVEIASGKVLVVDDNADMRRYIARLLSTRFEVITAADGVAALALVQQDRPDLVLSDVMMPKLDGMGLVRAIRARPDLRTLPVILLSARAGEDSRIEGLDAGADDYLVKPFSARELMARINVHLHLARIRGQAEERERELRTEAEHFARALRESNARLSASLLAAGTGTFLWDVRTNRVDSDEALDRLYGLPAGESLRSFNDSVQRIHPDDRGRVIAICERSAKSGADFELEYRVLLPDGRLRWLAAIAKGSFDAEGKPEYMSGACVDITRRKRVETFVWRQKDVLEQIVAGAAIGDVLETLTLDVEQAAERRLIATVMIADPDGRRLRMTAGRRCPRAWASLIDGLATGPAATSCGTAAFRKERVIVRDVNASPLWSEFRTAAVKHGLRACTSTPIVSSDGVVLGTFALYQSEPAAPTEEELRYVDIVARTAAIVLERDRAQRALRESQAQLAEHAATLERRVAERTAKLQEMVSELESFSYSISHDMRAPLRAMQSFAQILAEECGEQVGPAGKDYLRRIINASDRMDRLIQDVLIYSRVTRTELKLERVNVETLLDGILETYPQFQLPAARVEIQHPIPPVLANEAALTQCFSNLIGNAVKFVSPGLAPHVRIWSEQHGDRVRVYVRDNGIGIEKDAHEKIFHIFYQLDRGYEGTGIGLSIVRKAAERMGGSVGLESQIGRGSTFHVELNAAT